MKPVTERVLDVSDLEPPEPLERTLAAAEDLLPGQYLRMLHRRFPCLLFENLEPLGFEWILRSGRQTACEVFIWRRMDSAAAGAAKTAAAQLPAFRD